MKNYLTYPIKYMNLTQTYNDSYSHNLYTIGSPKSYPIDDASRDTGRDYFYIPCDEMVVKRIYGVGNNGINTIWLESTSKVYLADGSYDFVNMLISHVEDEDLKNIKIGMKYTRNQAIFREGKDGYDIGQATGNHFHIDVAKGKFINNGWVKNSKGAWTIKGNAIKPEQAFYVDKNFTTIINSAGLIFKVLSNDKKIYFKEYNGNTNSLVDALKSLNENSSYSYRSSIARVNNINNYTGSSSQNRKMLNLLKQGLLIKP